MVEGGDWGDEEEIKPFQRVGATRLPFGVVCLDKSV